MDPEQNRPEPGNGNSRVILAVLKVLDDSDMLEAIDELTK